MARHGDVTLGWADGEYPFRLAIAQLIAVQEECDAGPAEILARLQDGRWRVQDVRAPIFQGLLGGGLGPAKARQLVVTYVENRPLVESLGVAQAVLLAALMGAPDGDDPEMPPGKPEADPSPCPEGK